MMRDVPGLELPEALRGINPEKAFEGVKKAFEDGGVLSQLA